MPVYESKEKTKDGRKWFFQAYYKNIYGINKPKKSGKFLTKKEAQNAEREFFKNLSSMATSKIILNDLFNEYEAYISSKKNKESSNYADYLNYNNHVGKYLGNMSVCDITLKTIREWHKIIDEKTYTRNDAERFYGHEFKTKMHSLLSCILDYAVQMEYLLENVAKRHGNFQSPKDEVIIEEENIKYQTPEEYEEFISVIDDLLWETFFSFAYWNGCRKGEQQAITWEDVDFEKDTLRFNKTLSNKIKGGGWKITNTKNRKSRRIDLLPQLKPILFELYNYYKKYVNFDSKWHVFGGIKFVSNTTIDNKKKEYYDIVEAKNGKAPSRFTHHQFGRHSHASLLISLGVHENSIAARLGDTPEVIRKTYAHLFPTFNNEIRNALTDQNIKNLSKEMERYKK